MSPPALPVVIVSHTLPKAWLRSLNGHCRLIVGPTTLVNSGLDPALQAQLSDAEGLLTILTVPVNKALLKAAPKLRVISNMAVGVDNIDLAACTQHNIPVGHTPGVLTNSTADLTMALLLSVARRLPEASQDARDGRWTTWVPDRWLGADLSGATLGIVGLGQVGQAVARRAKAFGMNIIYTGRHYQREAEAEFGARRLPLDKLLHESDFVSLHVPLTRRTKHLIDEAALRSMKPRAFLINMARGPIVDSAALHQALSEGWIAGAGLDVTDPEPLPADHPLYQLPNCYILPHIGSATTQTRQQMAELACANLLAGLAGERLPHCANPAVYGP